MTDDAAQALRERVEQLEEIASPEPANFMPVIEALLASRQKLREALEKIGQTNCYAHPGDLSQYRRETAREALTADDAALRGIVGGGE